MLGCMGLEVQIFTRQGQRAPRSDRVMSGHRENLSSVTIQPDSCEKA